MYSFFDLEQQKHQRDPQKDMSYAGHTGKGPFQGRRQVNPPHLHNATAKEHQGGKVQSHLIKDQHFPGISPEKGQIFLQQKQQEEKDHSQKEIMGVHRPQRCATLKAIELGELPVKYPTGHGQNSIDQRQIGISFFFH